MARMNDYMHDGASAVSRAVLALLQENLYKDMLEEIMPYSEIGVTRFNNCREQGYTVYVKKEYGSLGKNQINISFAEHRSSDKTVVYVWNKYTFNAPKLSDMDNDGYWNNMNFFKYDEIYKAMEFIKNTIVEFCSKK